MSDRKYLGGCDIGGSLGLANADRIIPGIAEEMKKHLNVAPPEILPTSLGHDVVLWGAIAAAMEAAGSASWTVS